VATKTFDRGFITMHGTASLKDLVITKIYTTQNEDSSNFGALSITCTAQDGTEIVLRTIVLKDADGKTITADKFPIGSVIDAKGVVDVYNGVYQLKIFSASDITFRQ
jgi:DNA/RNA endonuclease YhcR with UshA esterase domain